MPSLPLPRPADLLGLTRSAVGQAAEGAATLAAVPARAFGLLDSVETLIGRINAVVDRAEALVERTERTVDGVEQAMQRTERVIEQVETVTATATRTIATADRITSTAATVVSEVEQVSAATALIVTEVEQATNSAAGLLARSEALATTVDELLTAYETTLRKGAPMASRFVEQLSPEEVDAAIRLVDELPRLTSHLTSDILPILATLDRVGPDIHELLEVTRDLKLAVAGIPGLKMLRRRGEQGRAPS